MLIKTPALVGEAVVCLNLILGSSGFFFLSHPSHLALKHWRHLRNPGWRRRWELSAQRQWCLFISRKSPHSRLSGTRRRAAASSAPWHVAACRPCQSGSCPGQIWAESDGNLCHVGWTLINRGTSFRRCQQHCMLLTEQNTYKLWQWCTRWVITLINSFFPAMAPPAQ